MSSRRRLIAINAALLAVLALVALSPAARAQRAGNQRTPGTYTMVSGKITGSTPHAVYIVDSTNQEMLTLLWNQSSRGLDVVGYRDINADSQAVTGR